MGSNPARIFWGQLEKKAWWVLISPFAVSTFAVLNAYKNGATSIPPLQTIRPLLVLWGLTALLVWPAHKITRNWAWTGLALFSVTTCFFLNPTAFQAILFITSGLGVSFLLIKAVLYLRIKRTVQITAGLILLATNFLSVVFLAAMAVVLALLFRDVDWSDYQRTAKRITTNINIPDKSIEVKPDIYYIVLDGYGRSDILEAYYQYDNSAFVAALESKGFFVPSHSYSNYARTATSLSSTLNGEYITENISGVKRSGFWWLMTPLIEKNTVKATLMQMDYQTISIASGWSITRDKKVNLFYAPEGTALTDIEYYLLASTPLQIFRPILEELFLVPSHDVHRKYVLYSLETLATIPRIPEPTFTFAHIISPHPPFVFDEKGNPVNPTYPYSLADATEFRLSPEEYRGGYVSQIRFINKRLEEVIDVILATSPTPPIIIIQADHGPGMYTDFDYVENTCVQERFSIFSAYYLPGLPENPIPDDITSVNTFRIIFNKYFKTSLPLLEDITYYHQGTAISIFDTIDVSPEVQEKCGP